MDNKIQEELRAIQTEAFAKFCGELLKHNANPQSLFAAELAGRVAQEAIASLTSLINREVVRELKYLDTCPPPLIYVGILDRIKHWEALTPGGSDNETN